MTDSTPFRIHRLPGSASAWKGGEPRVFTKATEDDFPVGLDLEGARLIRVHYAGGGLGSLFDLIAEAAGVSAGSFQALLENLEDLSQEQPLVLFVTGVLELLADTGPVVLELMTGWEGFARHPNGVSAMYLVLEIGPAALVNRAFFPGGRVDWVPGVQGR